MALNWDITECERLPREPNEDGELVVTAEFQPVLHAGIWRMMATDLGWQLTEKNAGEFYVRSKIWEGLHGDRVLTWPDVHRLVGLRVNISPLTRTKWMALVKEEMDRLAGSYARQVAGIDEKETAHG